METFLLFAFVGFSAQIVDGALGMAYGVISSTVLLAFGVPPAQSSAAVHAAEVFTTGASGMSHVYHRNIDWGLFARLVPAGVIGGVLGAYILTSIDGDMIRPFIVVYLALMACLILVKSFISIPAKPIAGKYVVPLGLFGGLADATGGGGWGPMVTSSLLGAGGEPRYVIGTVNAAEFFVSLAVSVAFLVSLLTGHWDAGDLSTHGSAIAGLIIGGVLAAPLAGYVLKRIERTLMMRLVGTLVMILAAYQGYGLL
ncbi:MAG: sulfite exporter TauE/SafE family protein [Rhizobiaceae bacterium]